jgi:hypothetical protein
LTYRLNMPNTKSLKKSKSGKIEGWNSYSYHLTSSPHVFTNLQFFCETEFVYFFLFTVYVNNSIHFRGKNHRFVSKFLLIFYKNLLYWYLVDFCGCDNIIRFVLVIIVHWSFAGMWIWLNAYYIKLNFHPQ